MYGIFACIYVQASCAWLMPTKVRRRHWIPKELELQAACGCWKRSSARTKSPLNCSSVTALNHPSHPIPSHTWVHKPCLIRLLKIQKGIPSFLSWNEWDRMWAVLGFYCCDKHHDWQQLGEKGVCFSSQLPSITWEVRAETQAEQKRGGRNLNRERGAMLLAHQTHSFLYLSELPAQWWHCRQRLGPPSSITH